MKSSFFDILSFGPAHSILVSMVQRIIRDRGVCPRASSYYGVFYSGALRSCPRAPPHYGVFCSGAYYITRASRPCPSVAFSHYGVFYSGAKRSCLRATCPHGVFYSGARLSPLHGVFYSGALRSYLGANSLIGAMKVGLKVGQVRLAHRASHAQIACVFYYHFSSFC